MKKKITLLLAFSIIFPVLIFGQGETSNWYFGNNAGIRFNNNGTDFEVIPSNKAIFDNIEIIDLSENNSIYIEVSGEGDYEYSIDGLEFFDSNIFEQVPAGFVTVQVRDKNGCGVVEREISVLGYPKFFTPNGDGFNDKWRLIGFNTKNQMNPSISIFDRYGKKVADIGPDNHNWNGTYNSQPLPSSDYWFKASLKEGV